MRSKSEFKPVRIGKKQTAVTPATVELATPQQAEVEALPPENIRKPLVCVDRIPCQCPKCRSTVSTIRTSKTNSALVLSIGGKRWQGIRYEYHNCECGQVYVVRSGITEIIG